MMKTLGKAWQFFIFFCLGIWNLKATCSSFITLNQFSQDNANTSCVSGLVEGDIFVYHGTFNMEGTEISDSEPDKWSNHFTVSTKGKTSSFFEKLYDISVYTSDCGVAVYDPGCRCVHFIGNVLTYEVRYTASTQYSEHQIRARWSTNDGFDSVHSLTTMMPPVYETEVNILYINFITHRLDEDIYVVEGMTYHTEYCASNLLGSSVLSIRVDGGQTAGNSTKTSNKYCTEYTFEASKDVIHRGLFVSYNESEGCQRSGFYILILKVQDCSSDIAIADVKGTIGMCIYLNIILIMQTIFIFCKKPKDSLWIMLRAVSVLCMGIVLRFAIPMLLQYGFGADLEVDIDLTRCTDRVQSIVVISVSCVVGLVSCILLAWEFGRVCLIAKRQRIIV